MAARGPHADHDHEMALTSAKSQHEATMAAVNSSPPPQKTIQESMLDAAKARQAFAMAAKTEAETANPERFHPRPKPKGPA